MPSPVGHSLAGLAFRGLARALLRGRLRGRRSPPAARGRGRRALVGQAFTMAALVFAANAPDLDFVPGILAGEADRYHHGPAHSLGAAVLFGVVAWLVARLLRPRAAARFGLLMGLAFASHLVLDMFSLDMRAPNGVPLLWPLASTYFVLPAELFLDIQRIPEAPNFLASLLVWHNLVAMLREAVVMGVVLGVGHAVWMAIGALRRPMSRRPLRREGEVEREVEVPRKVKVAGEG